MGQFIFQKWHKSLIILVHSLIFLHTLIHTLIENAKHVEYSRIFNKIASNNISFLNYEKCKVVC